jgi:glycosyltransferase involved in cell wall biosynthesis
MREQSRGIALFEKADNPVVDKKRVLLVVRWPVGGIRTFIRYVYRNFDPSEWHFTIVAPDMEEMRVLVDDLSDLDVAYIPVCGIPTDGSSGFWKMFRSVSSLVIKGRFDLVHSHGFISGMCAAVPAFFRRTPHLMTSHETLHDKQFAGLKGRIRRLGMAWLFGLIDKVHSVSHDAQANLFGYFPSLVRKEGKCVVIPNGIEVERFLEAEPRDLRGELGLGEDVFLIGFMGRFMAPKGFRYLVDAIEILRNEKTLPKRPLVLAFGDGGFIREEKEAIKARGLENNFCFMPFTSNVAGSLKGVDVVAIPSLWEACPLLPMESLVCGTPLIGSDCVGLREVLQGTPAIVVGKAEAVSLARELEEEMKTNSRELFLNYCATASDRFNVKNTVLSINILYSSMLSTKALPAFK